MSWFRRLKNAIHPRPLDEELAEELTDHLARRTSAFTAQGVSPQEAHYTARRRFGNVTRLQEESRDRRVLVGLETCLQDFRYAWRTIWNSPGFAITAILSLTLAIGANTAIYSIVDAAILQSLPVHDPGGLFALENPKLAGVAVSPGESNNWSYPEYLQLGAAAENIAQLSIFTSPSRMEVRPLYQNAPLEKVSRAFVSGNAFTMLGVSAALGRLFTTEDDRLPAGPPSVILSYEYWQRRFHADPNVAKRILIIDGRTAEIRGVAAKGFFGVEPGKFVDIWSPAATYDPRVLQELGWHWCSILGRTAPGTSITRLQSALQIAYHQTRVELTNRFSYIPAAIKAQSLASRIQVRLAPNGISAFRENFSQPLWIVFAVSACILLVACANVAGLLLARSAARTPELATRVALGASRGRIVQQMMTEGLWISVLAGTGGWLIAHVCVPLLVRMLSTNEDPLQLAVAINTRVLLFCALVAAVSTILFALLPGWQASRVQPLRRLRDASGASGRPGMAKFFVGAQIAGSFCLVVLGSAFLFSLGKLLQVNPGFDPHKVTVFEIVDDHVKSDGSNAWDQRTSTAESKRMQMAEWEERVSSSSGIQSTAIAFWPIFTGEGWSGNITLPGQRRSDDEEIFYRVSGRYFATMRTPLLSGRTFTQTDSELKGETPVVVNEAFAKKYFHSSQVLGRYFHSTAIPSPLIIIGVAANSHYGDLRRPVQPILYFPLTGSNAFTLYVRSALSFGQTARLVSRHAQELRTAHIRTAVPLETLVGETMLREKLLASLGSSFAFLGGSLAAIGLFGLLNYFVTQRRKEIGIRSALGAPSRQIAVFVVREVGWLTVAGLAVGFVAAGAVLSTLQALLFGLKPWEPAVASVAALAFLSIGAAAVALPALRAMRVDPVEALRQS